MQLWNEMKLKVVISSPSHCNSRSCFVIYVADICFCWWSIVIIISYQTIVKDLCNDFRSKCVMSSNQGTKQNKRLFAQRLEVVTFLKFTISLRVCQVVRVNLGGRVTFQGRPGLDPGIGPNKVAVPSIRHRPKGKNKLK